MNPKLAVALIQIGINIISGVGVWLATRALKHIIKGDHDGPAETRPGNRIIHD